MLVELAVRNLGVIAEARIPLLGGLTAVTGETGAGKSIVVDALGLLGGAKPDPGRVRPGAERPGRAPAPNRRCRPGFRPPPARSGRRIDPT